MPMEKRIPYFLFNRERVLKEGVTFFHFQTDPCIVDLNLLKIINRSQKLQKMLLWIIN
jgi:hypothetical protein